MPRPPTLLHHRLRLFRLRCGYAPLTGQRWATVRRTRTPRTARTLLVQRGGWHADDADAGTSPDCHRIDMCGGPWCHTGGARAVSPPSQPGRPAVLVARARCRCRRRLSSEDRRETSARRRGRNGVVVAVEPANHPSPYSGQHIRGRLLASGFARGHQCCPGCRRPRMLISPAGQLLTRSRT